MAVAKKLRQESVQTIHLTCGVHAFGNSTTINAIPGKISLELCSVGVVCIHHVFGRKALVPFSNIKAVELHPSYEVLADLAKERDFGSKQEPQDISKDVKIDTLAEKAKSKPKK